MSETEGPLVDETGNFTPGDRFHGYVVERPLGKGAVGTVYLVRHEMLDTLFALKVMDPEVAQDNPDSVKRFMREAKLASKIRHPNLVTVHDAGFDAERGIYYIVMDYVNGGTLRQALAFGGTMDEKEAVRIVMQVAAALDAAQPFGVVHRDIKPENIMLTPDGTVKLVDLGVAKIADGMDSLKTMSNSVFGTPAYISPEQAMDSSAVDSRADMYSLGIVFFEMLCGRRPYEGASPGEIIRQLLDPTPVPDVRSITPNVSQKLAAVLLLMCAKRPEDRMASPAALLQALSRLGYGTVSSGIAEIQESSVAGSYNVADPLFVPHGLATSTMSFDTDDEEIKAFVTGLKRKRMLRMILWIVVGVALAISVAFLVALLG